MQGTNVVFSSQRGDGTVLRVALEANNFEPAFARYKTCVSALIPHTFDQVARMLIGYAPGASELGSAAKAQLDNAIRYAKADPKVLGILVDAHSAPMATREESDLASQRQAELVTSYLIAKGVSEETVNARWHGDKFPVAKNDTKAGQARNRRVTVRLETAATRAAMEKRIAAILAAEQQATALAAPEQTVAQQKSSDVESGRSSARPETVTLDRPPPGKDVAASDSLPLTLEQLEQMVEQQDLASGR
jgi:outer membrane protein OmpA-like peptidoglycan-associated protein